MTLESSKEVVKEEENSARTKWLQFFENSITHNLLESQCFNCWRIICLNHMLCLKWHHGKKKKWDTAKIFSNASKWNKNCSALKQDSHSWVYFFQLWNLNCTWLWDPTTLCCFISSQLTWQNRGRYHIPVLSNWSYAERTVMNTSSSLSS